MKDVKVSLKIAIKVKGRSKNQDQLEVTYDAILLNHPLRELSNVKMEEIEFVPEFLFTNPKSFENISPEDQSLMKKIALESVLSIFEESNHINILRPQHLH